MIVKKINDITYGIIHKEIKIKSDFVKINSSSGVTPSWIKNVMPNHTHMSSVKIQIEGIVFPESKPALNYMTFSKVENNVIYQESTHDLKRHPDSRNGSLLEILGRSKFDIGTNIGIKWYYSDDHKNNILLAHKKERIIIRHINEMIKEIRCDHAL